MSKEEVLKALRMIGNMTNTWDSEAKIGLTSHSLRILAFKLAVKMFRTLASSPDTVEPSTILRVMVLCATLNLACKVNVHSPRLRHLKKDLLLESRWVKEWRDEDAGRDPRLFYCSRGIARRSLTRCLS